jgi:hypothetical protein
MPVLNVDISIRDFDGQAVIALQGQLSLADTPGVASHLITAVTASGPSVIMDLAVWTASATAVCRCC